MTAKSSRAGATTVRPRRAAGDGGGARTATRPVPRRDAPRRPVTGRTSPARRRSPRGGGRPPVRPRRTFTLTDPRRRLRAACVAVAVLLSIFVGRLLQLQAVEAPAYAAAAEAGRLRTVQLLATRGQITDMNGTVLATSVAAKNVTVDQTLVTDPASEAMALSPLLTMDASTLVQKLTGSKRYAVVARQITPELWSQVNALNLPGIFLSLIHI